MGRVFVIALALLGLLLPGADAQSDRRVALVIGNAAYEEAGILANPVNDAADIAATLRTVGFEVIEGRDLGKRDLERKLGEFSDALAGADVALLFYAGHGIQVDGRNFIVPTDARLDVPAKLRLEALQMDDIMDIMESQARTSLVFLDACRNNPFTRSLNRTASSRAAVALAGLAQFDSTRGSFIAFSTAPGAVALDGSGRNSPFAAALVAHMATPGQSISDMMIAVRRDVVAATRDQQRPWEQGSLLERFEFVPADGAPPSVAAPAAKPEVEVAALERSVVDQASVEDFLKGYLKPDAADIEGMVRRLYAPDVLVYGVSTDRETLAKAKADWFAAFRQWTLSLAPGTLRLTPRGETRVEAVFDMAYDYVAKDVAATRATGSARVALGLEKGDGGWRITSESSQALP
ncbi:MAG: caspase family protein [Rhizobiaceae bacterium]